MIDTSKLRNELDFKVALHELEKRAQELHGQALGEHGTAILRQDSTRFGKLIRERSIRAS